MKIEEVKEVVRDSLGLDGDKEIKDGVPVSKLDAERINVADILFEAGVYSTRHFSDGKLNEEGRNFLIDVGESLSAPFYAHFASMATSDTKDIFNRLTPADVCLMSEYKLRSAA